MSKDPLIENLKQSEECKKCDRLNHEVYQCKGRPMSVIPCNWFKEIK